MAIVSSIPSKVIYSVDVPEVDKFKTEFIYNYFVPDESVQDYKESRDGLNILADKMNLSYDVLKQPGNLVEGYLNTNNRISDLKKIPRYVKLTWSNNFKFLSNKNDLNSSKETSTLKNAKGKTSTKSSDKTALNKEAIFNKVIKEDEFASSYYTAIQFNNHNLSQQISSIFNDIGTDDDLRDNFPRKVAASNQVFDESNTKLQASMAAVAYQKEGLELKKRVEDDYLKKINSTKFYSQINNNFLYSLISEALSNSSPNNSFHDGFKNYAQSVVKLDTNYKLTNDEYKASIPYHTTYQNDLRSNLDNDATFSVAGYVIEKFELFPDNKINKFDPIVIEGGANSGYIDFQIRYGAIYVYSIRTILDVTYNAIDNSNFKFVRVGSYLSSKETSITVQTIEHVAPPPPADFKIIWDYDRFNQNTVIFDHENNRPFPDTGVRGSLMLAWSMPVNSQMDIKKFQVFRRKSLDDPFELIKMYDFDDSFVKFIPLEDRVSNNLISTSEDPFLYFYDDDFYKNSEYIYAIASIDAHGLTSNYSEQFKITFNSFSNKLEKTLVSISGAPKSYPNLYLEKDLFVDTIKTSNKNIMNIYLNPDCIRINTRENSHQEVLQMKTSSQKANIKYCINVINTDVQKSRQLNINVSKKVF
ncbi:MAG: hypothetical protein EBU90_11325 [Proteobacteria bacterium]|nr:hypothetical protein [Pseudomonadota bacterium]